MSAKPAARKGDPTADGDSNPIDSGSPNVLFDGLSAAREGDTTECGSELCDQLSSTVLINGKAAVMVDSEGSAGNVVMSGSGTVLIGDAYSSPTNRSDSTRQFAKVLDPKTSQGVDTLTVPDECPVPPTYSLTLRYGNTAVLTPFNTPDFQEISTGQTKNRDFISFTIKNHNQPADRVEIAILSNESTIYFKLLGDLYLNKGEHIWNWDGFSNNDVFDTALLKNLNLRAILTAHKGSSKSTSVLKLKCTSQASWVDLHISKATKRITATVHPRYSRKIEQGSNPAIESILFETLQSWMNQGIEYYWSRDGQRSINRRPVKMNIDGNQYSFIVKAQSSVTKRSNDSKTISPLTFIPKEDPLTFSLIENKTEEEGGSVSTYRLRRVTYSIGFFYQKRLDRQIAKLQALETQRVQASQNPELKKVEDAQTNATIAKIKASILTAARAEAFEIYKETAAHEFGHLILETYAGGSYSITHKGTSTWYQQTHPNQPLPTSGEVDLMKYYDKVTRTELQRVVASETDAKSLLWLGRVHINV